jgi:hypothetical protein
LALEVVVQPTAIAPVATAPAAIPLSESRRLTRLTTKKFSSVVRGRLPRKCAIIEATIAGCSSSPDLQGLPIGDAGTDSADVATPVGDAGDASDGGDALDLCAYLSGRTFVSEGQSLCGVTPDGGTYSCPQFVFFYANGTCTWTYEDTGFSGTYSCLGLTITVVSHDIGTFMATYDPGRGILNWYNGTYQLQ